ncbi:hypothetical protein MMC19_000666, partial [Ptychographa xylographoides]|nr:hypothetical protein [Ptychographa xylographoides]
MLGTLLQESPEGGAVVFTIILICVLLLRTGNPLKTDAFSRGLVALKVIRKRMLGIRYLFSGAEMIDQAYIKAQGKAFVIETPGRENLMVTSLKYIKELNNAPLHQLSLHAVAKDFLQPKDTMHGFEWKSQRGVEGTGFVRALRILLTSHLPSVLPDLNYAIKDQIHRELAKSKFVNDYYKSALFSMVKKIVTRTNCVVFFGPESSNNQDFIEAALHFPEDVFLAAEILRIVPSSIASFIASLVTKKHKSSTLMYNHLFPIVQTRLEIKNTGIIPPGYEKHNDGIQWLIDTSPKRANWSTERLVGEIMAIWYGSVHTLAIATTYALTDLYSHEEYVEPLRNEVQGPLFSEFQETGQGLPLLDSFLMESARLSAFESTGVRRQALTPFAFSDGLTVAAGDWVCVPHRSMMRDSQYFENPLEFNGFRFIGNVSKSMKPARLTDASESWL